MQRSRLFVLVCAGLVLLLGVLQSYADEPLPSAAAAWQRLKEGNARFAADKAAAPRRDGKHRAELVKSQKPIAVVLSCADSRVVPELLFDQGLGDLFVLRVAGNISDPGVIGSIEYAIGNLKPPLIVVLGHDECGAVHAALSGKIYPDYLGKLVKQVHVDTKGGKNKGKELEAGIRANALYQAKRLTELSPLLKDSAATGRVRVVTGVYSLESGLVEWLAGEASKSSAIPDKNLEAAVRAVLHEPKAELTEEKLGNVYVLEAPGKSIRNLDGLEKCKNLALLKLSNNQVSDLRPLQGLSNLQSLDLSDNKIADVTPLGSLPRLYYLELSNNQISTVTALGKLTSLSSLYLGGNKVSDLRPLGALANLSSLSLGRNQIKDLGPLATVTKLLTLDLNDNQIVDLAPLAKQKEINLLMLERNKITDLTPLVQMATADAAGAQRFAPYLRLYLAGNPLPQGARSSQIPALKKQGVRVESAN